MLKRRQLMIAALITVAGLPMVLASVPRSDVSNDTAIYQNLHEIKLTKAKSINFDSDINRLSAQEKSHREALPLRISAPMTRVMSTPYRASPTAKKPVQQLRHSDQR
ncbi:MAG: hypothetical protein HY075_11385 [Deltaproteobacteria bacterium]|nr:hypothetical protein [Deltaproteobacteria bacterium]